MQAGEVAQPRCTQCVLPEGVSASVPLIERQHKFVGIACQDSGHIVRWRARVFVSKAVLTSSGTHEMVRPLNVGVISIGFSCYIPIYDNDDPET